MYVYNSESKKKEEVTIGSSGVLNLYTCGPTVYNYAHIGNLRTYVFEDLLKRALLYFDFRVYHVMNITDVEDKIIERARISGELLSDFTSLYTEEFFEDLRTLSILVADVYPRATDHIPEMIALIETLLETGHAYKGADGSVYFRIASFPQYGRLSHLDLSELKAGASERVSGDEYEKESASDFVLWKGYDKDRDGVVFWESPFGKGRPGWHIECSAMAMRHLGPTVDIHCGGVDNLFPHHENEIAQSECCTRKQFVRYWMHSEHLIVDGKKMSKSAGNFYTLRDLLEEGYTGPQIRYLLISTHYRTQLNFTKAGLEGAKSALDRVEACVRRLKMVQGEDRGLTAPLLTQAKFQFDNALRDDLNISVSLAALFDLIRELNILIDEDSIGQQEAHEALSLFSEFDGVIGCLPLRDTTVIPPDVQFLFEERQAARAAKNWKESDRLRELIASKGYVIEDAPSGSVLRPH